MKLSEKMRILLINDYANEFGGAEKVVFETKRLFEEKSHVVKIFGSNKKENIFSFFSRWFSLGYYYQTKRLIENFKPDIVHCHGFSRVISPSPFIAAKICGVPIVLTLHDSHIYCPKTWGIFSDGKVCKKGYNLLCPLYQCKTSRVGYQYIPYHFLKWLKVGLHRQIIKKYADHFICPSKKLKELIQKTLKIPKDKITYLPNFIEFNENKKIDFDKINPKLFLFVGRISKEKGIDVAIKAINYLVKKENLIDIKLNIIGGGPELENLKKLVVNLELDENIDLLCQIDNEKLYQYYQESCAVLMPSLCLENNPLVALESMKNKKPIIASNVGGYPDLIEQGKNGCLFEMNNHREMAKYIKTLYNNKELSIELGSYGFEKLKREFNQEDYYKKLIEIYNSSPNLG